MARAIHVFRTPDRFVAGTVGQPGNRTFYLQAVHDSRVISVMLEKQQVAVLAERIAALLIEINRRFGTPLPPEADPEDLSPLSRVKANVVNGTLTQVTLVDDYGNTVDGVLSPDRTSWQPTQPLKPFLGWDRNTSGAAMLVLPKSKRMMAGGSLVFQ